MPRNATDTKNRILSASRTLYSSHGFDGTTMDDILTASGITKGAFYHHFKSKESLCHAVLDQVIADYHKLAESLDQDLAPIERLKQMISRLGELNASGEWVNCRLILRFSTDSHESRPKIKRKLRDFWIWQENFYEELIAQCRNSGQLTQHLDAKTQARLIIATIAGANLLDRSLPSDTTPAEIAEILIHSLTP